MNAAIQLNGTTISTQQAGSIKAGQRRHIIANAGGTVQSASWSVAGSTIGSWTPGPSPSAADFSQQSPSFYWLAGASNAAVSVSGTLSDGTPFSGSASVNVSAPGFTMTVTTQPSSAIADYDNYLTYGNSQGTPGISFQATNLSGSGYSLEWVQIIANSSVTLKRSGNIAYSITSTETLDISYPYADNTVYTSDSPGWVVCGPGPCQYQSATYDEVVRSGSYQMYLMYDPNGSQSTWIPLQVAAWSFSFDFKWNASASAWQVVSAQGAGSVTASSTTSYPRW